MGLSYGQFTGNLGADATNLVVNNTTVTEGSMAVEKPDYGENKKTTWIKFKIWGKRGDALAPRLTKGTRILIVGELTFPEFNGKMTPVVDVSKGDLHFMDRPEARNRNRPQIEDTITDNLDKLDVGKDPFEL